MLRCSFRGKNLVASLWFLGMCDAYKNSLQNKFEGCYFCFHFFVVVVVKMKIHFEFLSVRESR